ncbi:glycosyltransferase [Prauserella marina]|uniref:glycosyltransferase n=1 Tax=Prauserella marina TaxID=530584 RepID=UPI000A6B78EC|nr:nucleotide disphospho-sugar-binding domain-containing protein [Prauserella marina]
MTDTWSPSAQLNEFLNAGPRPVYIGFGSMTGPRANRTGAIVAEAVRRAGVRVVLATGWGGLGEAASSEHVLLIDQAPHDWLFPRKAAVVHHGGGGTTAAALAAGRPQVVCPFVADQPHWAQRMRDIAVAPAPVRQQKLTLRASAPRSPKRSPAPPWRTTAVQTLEERLA